MSDNVDHSLILSLIIIGSAFVVFFLSRLLIRHIVRQLVAGTMEDQPKEEVDKKVKTLRRVLVTVVGVCISFFTFLLVLFVFGVDAWALFSGAGIASLAVGLAAEKVVKDFINGFFIIVEDRYRINDEVIINGINGNVEALHLKTTLVRDSNGWLHTIPHHEISTSTNMSREFSRVNMTISVGYEEDLGKVFKMIDKIGRELADDPDWKDDIISTPHVKRVNNLGESAIEIIVRGDTMPGRQKAIMGELRIRLKNAFDAEGISIAWPRARVLLAENPQSSRRN